MIESQGTTPENTQAPVPVTFDSLDSALAKVAELQSQVNELVRELARSKGKAQEYGDTIGQARKLFEEILAGDMDAEGTFEEFREPFELLEVSLEREVEVEITLTWRGTMTVPFNVDPEDLADYDFSADLESDRYPSDLSLYDFRIQER